LAVTKAVAAHLKVEPDAHISHTMKHNLRVLYRVPNPLTRLAHEKHDDQKLEPLSDRKFWSIIKRRHGEGVPLRVQHNPHACPWCDEEDTITAELHAAEVASREDPENKAKTKALRRAQRKARHLQQHKSALLIQRDWIKANVTAKLGPRDCLIEMDYVCTTSTSNRPIHNLVLAVHYKPEGAGSSIPPDLISSLVFLPLHMLLHVDYVKIRYITNTFEQPHDWRTTVGILDALLTSGEFAQFDHITFVSDNGSGFRQSETLHYYTLVRTMHHKHVAVHMLCPRHALNRCDAHGGHIKTTAAQSKAASVGVETASEFSVSLVAATKAGRLREEKCFEFDDPIDCGVVHWIDANHRKPPSAEVAITTFHAFNTYYIENGERLYKEGVVTASTTSDSAIGALFDFRPRKRGERCRRCEQRCFHPVVIKKGEKHECPFKSRSPPALVFSLCLRSSPAHLPVLGRRWRKSKFTAVAVRTRITRENARENPRENPREKAREKAVGRSERSLRI
jgi:hypothetical protein